MDLRLFDVVPGLTGPVQVLPSVVRTIVPPSPTAHPFVGEDIATPFRFTATGLARAVQTPATNLKIVPAFPTAIPSSPEHGEPEQCVMYTEFTGSVVVESSTQRLLADGTPFHSQNPPWFVLSIPTAKAFTLSPVEDALFTWETLSISAVPPAFGTEYLVHPIPL